MQKLHKVGYGDMFARNFATKTIDNRLNDLELDEKLMIMDNVIDYFHQNLKDLTNKKKPRARSPNQFDDEEHEPESTTDFENLNNGDQKNNIPTSARAAMAKHAMKKKLMAREAFVKKLARRGILPSKALDFKGSHLTTHTQEEQGVRIIDRDEKRR